jgi:hypothetical protein
LNVLELQNEFARHHQAKAPKRVQSSWQTAWWHGANVEVEFWQLADKTLATKEAGPPAEPKRPPRQPRVGRSRSTCRELSLGRLLAIQPRVK